MPFGKGRAYAKIGECDHAKLNDTMGGCPDCNHTVLSILDYDSGRRRWSASIAERDPDGTVRAMGERIRVLVSALDVAAATLKTLAADEVLDAETYRIALPDVEKWLRAALVEPTE